MAKLIKQKQPKLYDYYFKMREKGELQQFIDPYRMKPFLHISGMFGLAKNYAAFVAPIAPHPTNKNGVILFDLMEDAQPLIDLSVDEIRHRVFSNKEELGDIPRLPLKTLHYNRSPAVAPATFLKDASVVARLNLDGEICRQNLAILKSYPELANKISQVFMQEREQIDKDPDVMLYSGGFFSRDDKARMAQIRDTGPNTLSELALSFDDRRLPEMLMRYIGRNYPEQLSDTQRQEWEEYRSTKLLDESAGASICMDAFFARLNELALDSELPKGKQIMLQDLADYAQSIYPMG
jgi:exodeoxyribonuclease-1